LSCCYHDPQNKLQHSVFFKKYRKSSTIFHFPKFVQFILDRPNYISFDSFGGFLGDFLEDFLRVVMNSIPPLSFGKSIFLDVLICIVMYLGKLPA